MRSSSLPEPARAAARPGPARKLTTDRDGAIKLIDAAVRTDARRYVMVSAQAVRLGGEGDFGVYLRAKAEAEAALRESGLDDTIVRPGWLTDDPGTGRITAGEIVDEGGISRDDVAATLHAVLHAPNTIGTTFEVIAGDIPVEQAVAAL